MHWIACLRALNLCGIRKTVCECYLRQFMIGNETLWSQIVFQNNRPKSRSAAHWQRLIVRNQSNCFEYTHFETTSMCETETFLLWKCVVTVQVGGFLGRNWEKRMLDMVKINAFRSETTEFWDSIELWFFIKTVDFELICWSRRFSAQTLVSLFHINRMWLSIFLTKNRNGIFFIENQLSAKTDLKSNPFFCN